jgi:PAS domain S-box-containing protein
MYSSPSFGADADSSLQVLWEDGERVFCKGWRDTADGDRNAVLAVLPAEEHPTPGSLNRLTHEYGLKDDLDGAWAVRPLELVRERGRTMLVLEDTGGEPLNRLIGAPMEVGRFLRLAVAISAALGGLHERGLVHKDIKPTHILVNSATGQVWLMGFGIASRLPREHQAPEPPEVIAGTLAYMAPEQTGRMNRSIDSRSDLYSLGVTLYQMLTGSLPFTASDPMAWVHCHIARQPVPPSEIVPAVPAQISSIVMKLLAKTAEDRYQTSAGIVADFQRCLTEWEMHGRLGQFPLGAHDESDRLMIPERLYGREPEIAALRASFERVIDHGTPELVLVSGYSGIGKSSVVNELHKELVPPRGLFAAGKFDQYKRNMPYATVAQAFQSLVHQILGKSDAEMSQWRAALLDALGPNGQLIINLIPELAVIIGEQPPSPELPPLDQQARFQLVFRRFLGVFARPEHPLALFLDDLQWLDSATLDLIEHVVTHPEVRHLLLVGAYRDNQITPGHPLARMLATIREAGASMREIRLAPLLPGDVERLLADALHTEREHARSLGDLVFEKTGGNPFFTIQFLSALAEEALLTFDPGTATWTWDLPRIRAKGFTDNVADLMAAKLSRLPSTTQNALGQLACLGNLAETATLALIHDGSEEGIHAALWEAVRAGLILRSDSTYTFLHDRIQEAAYTLIAEGARAMAHLRIGRLLAARTTPEAVEENIFGIVNQFDRSAALITTQEERERVAELNLTAGKRAKASSAYAAALQYFTTGRALLADNDWGRCYRLAFNLELNRAECEYLTGQFPSAEERLSALSQRAQTTVDLAAVTCVRLDLYTILDQSDSAVAVGLDYLRRHDPQWSLHATAGDIRREYGRLWQRLESGPIEALIDLPLMLDPDRRATMSVLTALLSPAQFTDLDLWRLVIARMAALSLDYGNIDGSCLAYPLLGGVLSIDFGRPQAGIRLGRLGLELAEKRGFDRVRGRVYSVFALHVAHWTQHWANCRIFLRRAFEVARDAGDLTFATNSRAAFVANLLATGEPLSEVEREAESALDFVRGARFGLISDVIVAQLRFVRTLRGQTPNFNSFNDAEFCEQDFEQYLANNPRLSIAASRYWNRKLQAGVFAGNYQSAVEAASRVASLLWTLPNQVELAEYHFYAALARAGHCDTTAEEERSRHTGALSAHHKQISAWAESGPENFAHRAALLGAELARLERRELDAMRLYEEAVRSAHEQGFIQVEAIANELAARFYAAREFGTIAQTYLRNARYCYLRWGADGKVRQLDQLYPHLRKDEPLPGPASTILAPVEHLDLATVIKVSQAVSGEIVLEKLIDTLMRTAIEHAGAERGLLLLAQGDAYRIEAEAKTGNNTVTVSLRQASVTAADLPESVLNYVARTKESVLLHDASGENPFSADEYIHWHHARSILCLPLLNQTRLIGVLYLENNLTHHVFTSSRMAVLTLLASEAAISLENTRLYRDLQEREAKVRRLVDSNIIGIFIWGPDDRIVDTNEAFLRIVGYSRDDLVSRRMRWRELTPAEWRDADDRRVAELKATGTAQPYEKEYFQKSGSRVPVLVGAATFEGSRDEGVAFVVDLTDRKRAERAVRQSERRYREVQAELAHANRVATMGQLSASIAHEVNQPLVGVVASGNAGLRWLAAQPPDIAAAQRSLERVVRDGHRAAEILERIRALVKKAPAQKEGVDINEIISESIALTHTEAQRNGVALRTELARDLPLVSGDRIQLQQVILNLIVNAIEAMSDNGTQRRELLVVSREDPPNRALVAVRDSGPGLQLESLDRLFDAFYTTKPRGMGMGLAISRTIIESHGGRLWATPNMPQGANFQFSLPIDGDEASSSIQPRSPPKFVNMR